jgi:DnaJ-class molecular chaperone
VPTIEGPVDVTIPAATAPGAVLRLTGKGLPLFAGPGRGDLYLRLAFEMPSRLTREQQELYEQLRALEQSEGPH